MSIKITIGNQTIDFPSSGQSPNWAMAVDDFAQAVADQLIAIASPFDIAPRVQTLNNDANTNLNLNGVIFPHEAITAFVCTYSIYRTNGVISLAEQGVINGVYDPLTASWSLQQDFQGPRQADGTQYNVFNISGDQLQLSTVAIGGAYDSINSKISLFARTNLTVNS